MKGSFRDVIGKTGMVLREEGLPSGVGWRLRIVEVVVVDFPYI